jgi:predicted RNase H-like HicB family nuclease
MNERPRYSMAIQWSDEDETYVVSLPEWEAHGLIGHTHGDTYDQAVRNGQQMLHMLIESARKEGETLPKPSTFNSTSQAS